MNLRTAAVLAATALAGLAAWPTFVSTREAQASGPTPAPVVADYRERGRLVAFYEDAVRRHPDQIVTRLLASQYLQRFRETADPADLVRGEHMAERSLTLQPRFNVAAEMTLASSLSSLHRFREALVHAQRALEIEPGNAAAVAQVASAEIELGRYDDAYDLLRSARRGGANDLALATASARYDEISGSVAAAQRAIELAMTQVDAVIDDSAESRAWFHFRAGELAWTAGDGPAAEHRFREALDIFPEYPRALNGLARLYWSEHRWPEALDAARRAAALVPLPETLGYEADAQRALGDAPAARATDDLITAIARIGNAKNLNDRALALYFADHGLANEAVVIARRDLAVREDVFADDTLAWALARAGRWSDARAFAERAVRRNTADARLQYHAGVIAMETGERAEAARRFRRALTLNPRFHPYDADDARRRIAELRL
ncbi:MAG TPA: tetratricopeptide repeat protein [Candidatus Elarobacter sp.]|nr:tetratricopeptide repeat protein [Dongiaceae bacterium]HZW52633.1 tetratricopeptide repeat protein [Candidatus Elarobacter sp.]